MSHVILNKSVNMLRNVHRNHKAYWGQGEGAESVYGSTFCADSYFGIRSTPVLPQRWGIQEGDYMLRHTYRYTCHHQNDVCIRNKMGSDQSNFNVSLFVRDIVMGWCSQTTAFLKKKGQPKRI